MRLAILTGDDAWREKADRLFDGVLPRAADNLFSHAALLNALDLRLRTVEIVVTGPNRNRWRRPRSGCRYLNRTLLRASSCAGSAGEPSGAGQDRRNAGSAAFVCVGERCSLPVTDAAALASTAGAMQGGG